MAFEGNYLWVVIWIIIAAVCDFFDGFMARLLQAYSPIGKELDSLADMVSFGLAPSLLAFRYLSDSYTLDTIPLPIAQYIPYFSFLLVVFSGLRLAKFNVDERQTSTFIGLPTPANALFWISLCYGLYNNKIGISSAISFYSVLVLVFIFSLLLTAEVPMFSLKIKSVRLKGNELIYTLLLTIIVAVVFFGLLGIALGIITYILLSFASVVAQKDNKVN
jgi:CDP-diacylglycerol--serine O-phosphatidyltransferase